MKYEIIEKAESIIVINRSPTCNLAKSCRMADNLEITIVTPNAFFIPEKNLLRFLNSEKYDAGIVKNLVKNYSLGIDTKILGYKESVLNKYEPFLLSEGVIDDSKKLTKKGEMLNFAINNDLTRNNTLIELDL